MTQGRDYDTIAEQFKTENTPDFREKIDVMFHPDNILKLYIYAAIKNLGMSNVLTFEMGDDLQLPENGQVAFGFNRFGEYGSITILEGEALEAINNPGDGEPTPELANVRAVGDGEDTHSPDVSEPSTD